MMNFASVQRELQSIRETLQQHSISISQCRESAGQAIASLRDDFQSLHDDLNVKAGRNEQRVEETVRTAAEEFGRHREELAAHRAAINAEHERLEVMATDMRQLYIKTEASFVDFKSEYAGSTRSLPRPHPTEATCL